MNSSWADSLDQIWRSAAAPMWLTLAAAGFFGLILLITLVRAEKSVANGALTVITLLSIGIAVAATMRVYGPTGQSIASAAPMPATATASLPALSCLDDLAGDAVALGCEKALFGTPDAAAAAVSYTAARIDRLTALGDAATADSSMTLELKAMRKALEHDRYGFVAQVLVVRNGCTKSDCAAFRSLTDQQQIAANMESHLYDALVARYAPTWNAPGAAGLPATGALAGLPPSMPTGKPTNAEFPSASSTPAVSIMTPEPTRQAPAANANANAAPPPAARAPAAASAQAAAPAAKKPPAPKAARAPAAAPVPLAPPVPAQAQAPAPAAADNN
ncbi:MULTISPECIES: hypothetical protein [unclassified Bradyrhizobium]|uniref:hypothetical protein n=1 Tax=unclassified Bradyrhizobium TaxID=2631580 RepID=UPI0024789637|nr:MULTISPECIES: hypothetical protein [unclassified Bradyrhizobium]WGR74575.1 hypothetical protein MTX24_17845 [Bradyrhizobium sp. ISRA426]WGR79410.1 hypothetical protein MTX21_02960 [Bradyrhizobium sp. ISRA430]WGR89747.1 hypothetical protein MTX25_17525 [Bradyrhizobium sp. ISRA432]